MATESGLVEANGTKLYHETRGDGPTVLLIPGATGDAGHFTKTAEVLADEFTVITYDRRGNSRSPKPAGWAVTTIAEQADDAAGLIRALRIEPAAVFGTSGGADILLELILRHADVLRGAIVHEPPMMGVLENAAEFSAMFQQIVEDALAQGGTRGAMELFLRMNAGDDVFEAMDPVLRERLLGNSDVFFSAELESMANYLPDDADLAGVKVPVLVATGSPNRSAELLYQITASEWVADAFGTTVVELPGLHAPYLSVPDAFADALRPLLRKLS